MELIPDSEEEEGPGEGTSVPGLEIPGHPIRQTVTTPGPESGGAALPAVSNGGLLGLDRSMMTI